MKAPLPKKGTYFLSYTGIVEGVKLFNTNYFRARFCGSQKVFVYLNQIQWTLEGETK